MKTLLLLLLFAPICTFSNNEKKIPSNIKEVTIYLSGASIKRTAQVGLQSGTNKIIFNNLSNKIDENSIQVSGLQNASILSINYGIDYLTKRKNSEELESLENKVDLLLLKKNKLQNMLSGLAKEREMLDKNQRIGSDDTELSLEKVKEISTYYRERIIQIQNEAYAIEQKMDKLQDEITTMVNQIDTLSDYTKEERGEITLKLSTSEPVNLILELKYNVKDAGWFPLYDIKSENIDTPLKMTYKANVYQSTGTDWNDVKVILSTGNPNTNNLKPELTTRYLNFSYDNYTRKNAVNRYNAIYNPMVKMVTGIVQDDAGLPLPGVNIIEKGTANGTNTDFDGKYSIKINEGKELVFSYIGFASKEIPVSSSIVNVNLQSDEHLLEEVMITSSMGLSIRKEAKKSGMRKEESYNAVVESKEEGITNTQFIIKKKYSIISNKDTTVIEIDQFDINSDYNYYVAPELNENVFLTAKLGNWEQFNLLAGEANVYFEGNYAGKTVIDPVATTDSLSISLGIDPSIVVKRERLKNFKHKSFISNSKIVDLGYVIELKNNKRAAIQIILEERIPISQNKEIKIDDIDHTSAKYDPTTGILRWNLKIPSKGNLKQQFSYQIKYPKSKRINL